MKVTPQQYAQLILEMTENLDENQAGAILAKIAKKIRNNQDMKKVKAIVTELDRQYKVKEGIVDGQVISARALNSEQVAAIKTVLAKKFATDSAKVIVNNVVDESLKGGLIIQVGDEVWDGSIRAKLTKLKSSLI